MKIRKNALAERKRLIEPQYRHLRTKFTLLIFSFALLTFCICMIVAFLAHKFGLPAFLLGNPVLLFILLYVLSILLGTLLAVYVIRNILKPIEKLSEASKKVATGDFTVRLAEEYETYEMHTTYKSFNYMVGELGSIETLRDDFVANVSHEFKTPISAIEGYATLLQDPDLTEEEKNEYIEKIVFNTGRLSDLSGNILLLSKLQNDGMELVKEKYSLDEQLREAVLILEPKWSGKEIEPDLENVKEVSFIGARSLLLQVWLNIIGNAIKFTDNGGKITLTLDEDEAFVTASVTDTGIGMDEETKKHIFEKFYQGDTSRKSAGNGLGLALCHEIVSKCGGTISVISAPGEGSTFTVRIPK